MNRRYHSPLFISLALLLAAVTKAFYAQCTVNDLLPLLTPTTAVVESFLGIQSVYTESGFYLAPLHIVIDKSCSGVNFLVILFCTLATTAPYRYLSIGRGGLLFVGLLALSFLLTVFINASRILGAIMLLRFKMDFPLLGSTWAHEAEGVLIYLSALILTYTAIRKLYIKIENHAQYPTSRVAVH